MKTIIITGGTSGIGLNIANFFYKKSYNVAIAGQFNKSVFNQLKKTFDSKKNLILNLNLIKKKILLNL